MFIATCKLMILILFLEYDKLVDSKYKKKVINSIEQQKLKIKELEKKLNNYKNNFNNYSRIRYF